VFGAVNLETAMFHYRFADVFNGDTFFSFLKQLVAFYKGRKIFLIIDNAPAHWLSEEGKDWLRENRDAIELHRLPPYSPEFMPVEGQPAGWQLTTNSIRPLRSATPLFAVPSRGFNGVPISSFLRSLDSSETVARPSGSARPVREYANRLGVPLGVGNVELSELHVAVGS
jgi:hypothetical protein